MKTVYYFTACLLALFCIPFVACDREDGDTTKPVINLIEPAEGDILHIGEAVHLDMELSDDVMLKQYKVEIHINNDGHTHAHSVAARQTETETTVDLNRSWEYDVSDKKNTAVHHHNIVIPANATPGEYHFMVYCTDAAGNESLVSRNIVLSAEGDEDHDHDEDHDEDHDHAE